jgi:hypothetical protein
MADQVEADLLYLIDQAVAVAEWEPQVLTLKPVMCKV